MRLWADEFDLFTDFLELKNRNRNLKTVIAMIHDVDDDMCIVNLVKHCMMSSSWLPLTPEEEAELARAFEDYIEENRRKYKSAPKCTCELDALLRVGCKCGAFEAEMEEEEARQQEIDKKIEKALKEGVPYEERVRRYGRG